jgi:hypothetical protein
VSQRCALRQHSCQTLCPGCLMSLLPRLRCTSSRHCPSTPASLFAPPAPKLKLPLRSRCASAGHCSSSVVIRHRTQPSLPRLLQCNCH